MLGERQDLGPMSRHEHHYRKADKVNEVIAAAAKLTKILMVSF